MQTVSSVSVQPRNYVLKLVLSLLLFLLFAAAHTSFAQGGPAAGLTPAVIRIDAGVVKHIMAGGAGASWHAMGPEAYWYPNLTDRENRNSRGSGWGGNPPLAYKESLE